jgi:hypothetical protein
LEWDILLRVQLCFFALEDRTKASKLRHDTAYSPAVNGFVVVLCAHQEFRRSIPYGYHDFVASEKGLKRFITETGEAEIANLDNPVRGDQNICRLEVTMEDMT